MNLEAIQQFLVPVRVVQETETSLREAGRDGFERFVLWSGVVSETTFTVRTQHVPRQTSYKLANGLCVRVDGEELHRLNRWLFECGEVLGVQVHTHPTNAYHSETDDRYPIVTLLGGLSIVVPEFARAGLRGPGIAAYRLTRPGWSPLAPEVVGQLLSVEP